MYEENWKTIMLPSFSDNRGDLYSIEGKTTIPFEIKRIFYIKDVPLGAIRGGHAHRICHQFIIPIGGKIEGLLDNGYILSKFSIEDCNSGLYIPPMVWCELLRFSSNVVCLVLASEHYDESDYIRDKMIFITEAK